MTPSVIHKWRISQSSTPCSLCCHKNSLWLCGETQTDSEGDILCYSVPPVLLLVSFIPSCVFTLQLHPLAGISHTVILGETMIDVNYNLIR